MSLDVAGVTELVERVAAEIVAPRFRSLTPQDVGSKGAGDVVTVVDTEAEAAIIQGLTALLPGVPVVGEEGAAADPGILRWLDAPLAWVVDPLDGTRAFIEGLEEHAVMVALLEHGRAVAGWICLPALGRTYVAERGAGATRNGERLDRAAPAEPITGAASAGLPEGWREALDSAPATEQIALDSRLWSGYFYSQVADGVLDSLVYARAHPWDHAPGAVIVRELGGAVLRPDGSEYLPGSPGGGLVVGSTPGAAKSVLDVLAS
ncbi:inositol monophosphatase [Actinotalea sp.]|uniref:inositol monophosphatase family protein n=1 Tax=Actinotalea sp. TaxID=1872145 RepID=UPI003568E2C5